MSNKDSPEKFYSASLEQFTSRVRALQLRLKQLAFVRVGIFLAAIILIYIATRWGFTAIGIISLAGIIAFLFTVRQYLMLQQILQHDESMVTINSNELKTLGGNYAMFEDGHEFDDPEHPFSSDLDIFGGQSMFQYFNRSATSLGKHRLARWFLEPLISSETIQMRQAAVKEMAERPGCFPGSRNW